MKANRNSASQKPIVGILVVVMTVVGGSLSNYFVNSMIPPGGKSALVRPESPSKARLGKSAVPDQQRMQTTCLDLNGETFVWVWPNAPFGSSQCGRAD